MFEDLKNGIRACVIMSTYEAAGWLFGDEKGSKDGISGIIY